MTPEISPFLLKAPHCLKHTISTTAQYHWRNHQRGGTSFVIIQQTLSGHGLFKDRNGIHEVHPGHAFLAIVPERTSYFTARENRKPWTIRWLIFDGSHAFSLWREFRDRFGPVLPLAPGTTANRRFEELFQAIKDQRHTGSFHVSEAAYSFYLAWWQQLQKSAPSTLSPLDAATDFLRSHYRSPISIKELADYVGISREHLTRIFRARHGVSPGIFIRKLRLKAARQMLDAAKLPLGEVALRTGFPSARQLSKWLHTAP